MKDKKKKSLIQWLLALFAVVFLGVVAIIGTIPFVKAEVTGSLSDTSIALSDTGSNTYAWSASGTSITGSATGVGGTCSDSASETTLTIKNTKTVTAELSFSYTITLNSGTIKVNNTSVTANGTFGPTNVASNGTITVYLKSAATSGSKTSISITNILLYSNVSATTYFDPGANGSYTVTNEDGYSVTVTDTRVSHTTTSDKKYTIRATGNSGYRFDCWFKNDAYFLDTNPYTFTQETNNTVFRPSFGPANSATYQVGSNANTRYYDLNEAITAASSAKKISVVGNGTVPAGTYTIPSGYTLLVPFDAALTVYTTTPDVVYGSHATPSAYKTLTLANGANLVINGSLCCSGKLCATGQMGGWNGTPTGPDGRINMQSGSTITVKSGGNLYAWGYIYGSGQVTAESGSTVYESFQIKDWRGGTATSNVYKYAFIFSQYYVQNIEVPLRINAGATEKLYTSANASSSAYPMSATFIGSSGLFNISSGYMIKDYIESTDRLDISIYGNATISSMTISGIPMISSISTSDYIMPINSNITINLKSGTTTVNQDVELLPSVELNIDSGAKLSISSGKKVYLYDNDNWGNFTGSARLYVIGYSVANGTTAKRAASGLVDAKMNVNGSVEATGYLYTSAAGANITCSEGSGSIVFKTAPNTSTIYEMEGNSTKTSVSFTQPQLHNGQNKANYDGEEYTPTAGSAANTTFYYCGNCDLWYTGSHECPTSSYTITWKNYDGSVTLETDTDVEYGATPTYNGATPTRAADAQYTYTFAGWATSANQTSGITLPNVTGNATYYAAFSRTTNTYTVTWKNYDGSVTLETDNNVPYGTTPTYNGATPTKPSTQQTTYTFAGWATSANQTSGTNNPPSVTGNVTYYAAFSSATAVYQIIFKNYDGTTLSTVTLGYGETPSYTGTTPTKPSDAQYTYSFAGWNDGTSTYTGTLPSVTGEKTYTAVFSSTTNTYTITWKNEDGTVLETDNNVPYGTTPSYNSPTPTKEGNAQYSYVFNGWTPTVSSVTGDAVYTATFTQVVNTYTVIWMNGETVLETDNNVPYGTTPSYDGATPTRETSGRLHYVFLGWSANPDETFGMSPEFFMVADDTTYYAIFRSYAIGLYRDADGVTRLYDTNGNFQSNVSGLFFYDSSIYQEDGDDRYYYLVDGVLQEGYGLVAIRTDSITYLYYVLEDGSILMQNDGCTFYVAKTNGYIVNNINVESGLYYFDSDGHMWFGNSLLTGNTEFGVISSANAAIGGGN